MWTANALARPRYIGEVLTEPLQFAHLDMSLFPIQDQPIKPDHCSVEQINCHAKCRCSINQTVYEAHACFMYVYFLISISMHILIKFSAQKSLNCLLPQVTRFSPRGFIKRREAGIFPFYSGMFPLLLLINLYRVNRQILSNHPPTSA